MNIRPKNRYTISLESVAMTDIVMNMFIFFFVSFSLLYTFNPHQESKIKVNLPKGMTMAQMKRDNPLVVTVSAKNEIYIADTLVSERALNEKMTGYAKEYKDRGGHRQGGPSGLGRITSSRSLTPPSWRG
jgi:biopolymer transport protein ExbD